MLQLAHRNIATLPAPEMPGADQQQPAQEKGSRKRV